MEKVAIVSLGWLGAALYNKLEAEFIVLGTYFNNPKDVNHQVLFNINNEDTPLEILSSDIIIICIPPSKITNDQNFFNFLSKLKQKKIIFISSTSVYGMQGNVNELTKPKPETVNGKRLLTWEDYIKSVCDHYQIIRSAGQYGPNRHPGKYLAGKTAVPGKYQSINLISQDDLIDIIIKSIKESESKIINAVSSQHLNKKHYYVDYCKRNDLEPPKFLEDTRKLNKIVDTMHSNYIVATPLD